MSDQAVRGIWPPHEAFYIEAMLFCTTTALEAAAEVQAALEFGAQHAPASEEWQDSARTIVNGVQTIALQAAAISRYLWPVRTKEPHLSRAHRLRSGLAVSDDSCLRDRELRNTLEHFDERLDEFCQSLIAGVILPTYVGPLNGEPEVPTHFFRAYYTNIGVFEVLGNRFEMTPFLEEIQGLHARLWACGQSGGRIPPSPPTALSQGA
ncbi:MAG TPA: hypothetical protein VFK13_06765 [Gemmatimonadaceae bacterium]|nr:hypothetical protein [Gemmatimonadaceae bacterium]